MSSFSVLSTTILSASSGRGLASCYGAHPYIALFMGRQDGGHGFGWMGSTTALAMSWEKELRPVIDRCRADGGSGGGGKAIAYAHNLMMRQFSVRATRVVETEDPINYAYVDGRMGVIG